MKKLFLVVAAVAIGLSGCGKINDALDELDIRVTELESATIPTINEQIAAINTSIADLEAVDKELKGYITALQGTDSDLKESIVSINARIDEVTKSLKEQIADTEAGVLGELATAKADVLAQLEALKTEINAEIATVNTTIATLQTKDSELEGKIAELKSYVDTELKNTKDWASATFTTLEQYNALCADIATIKTQIESLNSSIANLESRLNEKIATDIATAVAGLQGDIATKATEITEAYTAAIKSAKDEITTAYTSSIQSAISTLETSMKQWVNEQLANYYTIAEVDAAIATLSAEFEGKLSTQKTYLESLVSSMAETLTAKITSNEGLITELRNSLNSLSGEVAANAKAIANNAENISANATSIVKNAEAIVANGGDIAANKKAIETNAALIAENKRLIAEVETKIDNTSNAANTKAIAENAKVIANNAELIAQNSVAISDNTSAIATNATEIAAIKTTITTTKTEITEAYTALINTSIETLNGRIDSSIATVNSRIDSSVATINTTIDGIKTRIDTLESDVATIKSTISSMQDEIRGMQENIANLLARIQSVTYVPKYSDGMATMDYNSKSAEFDFIISPKSAATELAKVWDSALSVKAIYTLTRAIEFIDLPITKCEVDNSEGVVSLTVSGINLSDDFYKDLQPASAMLQISDGNSSVSSEYVTMTPNYNIQFEDLQVKAICVSNWDTNNDGELSYEEAAAVTDIGTVFKGSSIIAFMELKYFTGITEISDSAFSGCSSLWKIIIPDNVETIADSAFNDCNSMVNFISRFSSDDNKYLVIEGRLIAYAKGCNDTTCIIPEGVTVITSDTFKDVSKIENVIFPDSLVEICSQAFYNCDSLAELTISTAITIGEKAFYDCDNLVTATINATSVGTEAFYDCDSLTDIVISATTLIGTKAFYDCDKLATATIDATTIGVEAFNNCDCLEIVTIGPRVSAIYNYAFFKSGIKEIYCKPLTPPAIYACSSGSSYGSFPHVSVIYVPASVVSKYTGHSIYSTTYGECTVGNWGHYAASVDIKAYDFGE